MDNKSAESADGLVTLILGDKRVEAHKEKLAQYSLYFSSLFSGNFKDHAQDEFKINYDISLTTLKNFVNWINNEGEHTRVVHSPKYFCVVRASLEKFLTGHYSELLELLELSVVFMAEKLTENIIEMIICMRLPPNNMLEIWLLAEGLGLKVLGNVALAACLDRFEELPVSLLVGLPIENFLKLVLNVNVRSTTARLQVIREEWKRIHGLPKDIPESFVQFLNGDAENVKAILDKKEPCYVQCVAGHKLNKSLGIWSWNGKVFQELTEMTDSQMHTTFEDNGKEIKGRQVIGRGFGIYLIGGEQGIGSGRFNTALWRYCPFSKKWYIETLLPRPRRHMAVAFIGNKLYLFGGVGRYRSKLSSVDIFNVHTGIWSKGKDVPERFTSVPPSFVENDKFVYEKSIYSTYDPSLDRWRILAQLSEMDASYTDALEESDVSDVCLLGSCTTDKTADMSVVYRAEKTENRTMIRRDILKWSEKSFGLKYIHTWKPEDGLSQFDQHVLNWPYIVSFAYSEGSVTVEVGELTGEDIAASKRLGSLHDSYHRLRIYRRKLNDVTADCFADRLGCFNLIDPESLHKLVPIPEQASISV